MSAPIEPSARPESGLPSAPLPGCADARLEIKQAIIWYEQHGYDWLSVVGYLSAKANGFGPPWIVRTRIGMSGRKRRHNAAHKPSGENQ